MFLSLYYVCAVCVDIYRPRGEESTEVRISQTKGKESENSYQKLKRSLKDRHMQTHPSLLQPPGGTFHKLSSNAIFVMCSQTFTLF